MQAPPRLKWRCRRGMREMDLLLERFLKSGYPLLEADERVAFERFLEQPDQVLYEWIVGRSDSDVPEFQAIALRIRATAGSTRRDGE